MIGLNIFIDCRSFPSSPEKKFQIKSFLLKRNNPTMMYSKSTLTVIAFKNNMKMTEYPTVGYCFKSRGGD